MALEVVPLLWLLSLPAEAGLRPLEPVPALTAVVVRVDGPAAAEDPAGRVVRLQPRLVLGQGTVLHLPAEAGLRLVCSSDRRVDLTGPRRDHPLAAACDAGRPVAPETYHALAGGVRSLTRERSRGVRVEILKARTRGTEEDDPRVPVLLDPRETAVRAPRPVIRWTRVPGASEYVLELVGPEPWTRRLAAGEVPCRREAYPPATLEVCSVAWPEGAPDLRPGAPAFLSVGARTARVTPLRAAEPRRIHRLPADRDHLVEESLATLRAAEGRGADRTVTAAHVLAGAGLRSEAAELLRRSLESEPSAAGFLLLGSLELERVLPRSALRSFREAVRLAAADRVLAAEAREGARLARRLLGEEPASPPTPERKRGPS